MDNFATAVAYYNDKVFVTDNPGNVQCLDANNGNLIWSATGGGWTANPHLIAVSNGIVFVGVSGGAVDSYDEKTGQMVPLSFQAPVSTSWGEKEAPQAIIITDGRGSLLKMVWLSIQMVNGGLVFAVWRERTYGWQCKLLANRH